MNSLTIRLLVVTVPLIMLAGTFALSEIIKNHHGKRTIKQVSAGALKGLSQGPNIKI